MSDFKHLDALLQKYVDDGLPGCGCILAKKRAKSCMRIILAIPMWKTVSR